jgi:hypothetical protein
MHYEDSAQPEGVAVMRTPDAPGSVCLSAFVTCMQSLTCCMNLTGKPMPKLLVLHVSAATGEQFGVASSGIIRHNRTGSGEPSSYYEIWFVGMPGIGDYVGAILGVLEDHFVLDLSPDDRQRAIESAMWALSTSDLFENQTVQ